MVKTAFFFVNYVVTQDTGGHRELGVALQTRYVCLGD